MYSGGPVFEDKSPWEPWLKIVVWGIPLIILFFGWTLLNENSADAVIGLGVAVFYFLLFNALMPRSYQIYSTKLRVVLGGPLAINIPFSDIREVNKFSGRSFSARFRLRLATSSKYTLEIVRRRGLSLVISPAGGDYFLEQLKKTMAAASGEHSAF